MLFNSLHFFIFFLFVTAAYFALPHKWRWQLLLTASCYFYMAFIPIYILILLFTIVIDYLAGRLIEAAVGRKRKVWLILSLIANVGVLVVFKYSLFLNDNVRALAAMFGATWPLGPLSIILPIGLSFHTFQAMSYTIEVYRGNQAAERHFGIYALYVMFYPQLVAGPIERPQNLLHQFRERHEFLPGNVVAGLRLILWGLFKKIVIADRLAVFVNAIYSDAAQQPSGALALATMFFAFQIFCDFSGYSDIAVGAARVMGFELMDNFDKPYQARSIGEFWKRWHISLSTWFRDYLYISLGGNRVGRFKWYRNLLIVFLVSGIWHGANWTFLIWGALHGFYLCFGIATAPWRQRFAEWSGLAQRVRLQKSIATVSTFLLVSFAWIFFRADNISTAWMIARSFPEGVTHLPWLLAKPVPILAPLGLAAHELYQALCLILLLEGVHIWQRHTVRISNALAIVPMWGRWAAYVILSLAILNLSISSDVPFIYFQF